MRNSLLVSKRVDHVGPTSESATAIIQAAYGISDDQMTVIPNGITPLFLENGKTDYHPDGPLVFFGRLARSKGVDVLIDALKTLRQNYRTRQCIIVGRGPAENDIRHALSANGLDDHVDLNGWMDPAPLARLLYGLRGCASIPRGKFRQHHGGIDGSRGAGGEYDRGVDSRSRGS